MPAPINTREVLSAVLLTRAVSRRLTPLPEPALRDPKLEPGERILGLVDARLTDGSFTVQVGDKLVKMSLPEGTRSGDQLDLMVLAREPRLTLALLKDAPSPRLSASATSLSDTGRFIGLLYRQDAKAAALATTAPHAVVTAPVESRQGVHELALSLKQALSDSGLFYESHLAQWVAGQRPLASLMAEPQSRLPDVPPPTQGAAAAPGAAGLSGGIGGTDGVASPVHPDALGLVRAQLDLLDTRQVQWHGEVWPGQEMDWQIAEDGSRATPDGPPQQWRTRLKLTLPHLGVVDAVLSLSGGNVAIDIKAAQPGTVQTFKAGQGALLTRLQDAGLKPSGLKVGSHDA